MCILECLPLNIRLFTMRLRILFILFLSISLINIYGQQLATTVDIDKFINNIDSLRLKTALLLNDSTQGFLINETAYLVDDSDNLILVRHRLGNHPGQVSGHLIRQSTYYFQDDTLIKVNQMTFDFSKLLLSRDYYFIQPKMKGGSKQTYKYYKRESELYLKKYQDYLKTTSD